MTNKWVILKNPSESYQIQLADDYIRAIVRDELKRLKKPKFVPKSLDIYEAVVFSFMFPFLSVYLLQILFLWLI